MKQPEQKKKRYFNELNISTVRSHQESESGQMMSSSEQLNLQVVEEINFNRKVDLCEKK